MVLVLSANDLIEVLDSLFPGLEASGEAEPGRAKRPTEVGSQLVELIFEIDDPRSSSAISDLFILVEVLFDKGAKPPWEEFAGSFLEDLLNSVSHKDLALSRSDLNDIIGPMSKTAAEAIDRTWVPLPDDPEPRIMDLPTYQTVQSSSLRWIIRRSTRRTPGDIYVGIGDIVRREAQSGSPS